MSEAVTIRAARIPDIPLSLSDVPAVTTAYQIGLIWQEGYYNGGSPVLDYKIYFKVSSATSYTVFETNQILSSTTVTGL